MVSREKEGKGVKRWIYLIFGVLALFFAGFIYAWSVISKTIAACFPEWTAAQLSLTFTLMMIVFCAGCMLAGFTVGKMKGKWYLFISAVLLLVGFLIASNAHALGTLYLGFAIIAGLGVGFLYNAVLSTMSVWFPDKQGLVSGILLMGFGFGSFFIGKIYAWMTPSDGSDQWRTTFLVFAIVLFVIMMICGIVFPAKEPDDWYGQEETTTVKETAMEIGPAEMLRQKSFWLYYIWAILVSAAGLILVSQSSGIAGQVGTQLSDGTIATIAGLVSIMNGVGRVIFGGVFDRRGYKPTMLLDMVIFIIAGWILLMALQLNLFALIVTGFIVGGFAYGGVTPTNSAIISDFFGRKNYSRNFSLINTNLLIASFGSVIAGRLYDQTGSFLSTAIVLIVLVAASFLFFIGIRRPGQ